MPWSRRNHCSGRSIPPVGSFTASSANRLAEPGQITHKFPRRGIKKRSVEHARTIGVRARPVESHVEAVDWAGALSSLDRKRIERLAPSVVGVEFQRTGLAAKTDLQGIVV